MHNGWQMRQRALSSEVVVPGASQVPSQPRQWRVTLYFSSVLDPFRSSEESKAGGGCVFLHRAQQNEQPRASFLAPARPGPFILMEKKHRNAFLQPFPSMRILEHLIFCSCGWHKGMRADTTWYQIATGCMDRDAQGVPRAGGTRWSFSL